MNPKNCAIVSFFCFLTVFILTNCDKCDKNILEGESLIFELTKKPLTDDDRFSVVKNNKFFVPKRKKTMTGPGIVEKNSLKFSNVNMSYSGKYKVDVMDKNGNEITSYTQDVCVHEKVPKPKLNITCGNEKVNLTCIVEDRRSDLSYSWKKNGKDISNTSVTLINIKPSKDKYTCTAYNVVDSQTSEAVETTCASSNLLFGFDFWIMVSILAGGGFLVLLLFIVVVSVSCRACRRKEKHQRDEEEYRLNYMNTSGPHGHPKSKQTARGQPAPAPPEPYDSVSTQDIPCETQPKIRSHQRARPPPIPIEDEEEQPPPLPQPRKKQREKRREVQK